MGLVHRREVGGLEGSLSSCARHLQERYRVEQPEKVRKQSLLVEGREKIGSYLQESGLEE